MYLHSQPYRIVFNNFVFIMLLSLCGLTACSSFKHSGQFAENDGLYFNSKDRKEVDEYAKIQANIAELKRREQQMLSESNLLSSREVNDFDNNPERRLHYDTTQRGNTRLFVRRNSLTNQPVISNCCNSCNNYNPCNNCSNCACNSLYQRYFDNRWSSSWSSWNRWSNAWFYNNWTPSIFYSSTDGFVISGNWGVLTWGRYNRWNSWNTWNTWNSWNSPYSFYSRREARRESMTSNPINNAPRTISESSYSNSSAINQRRSFSSGSTTGRTYSNSSTSGRSYSSGSPSRSSMSSSSSRSSSGSSSRSSSGSSSRSRR